MVMWRVGEDDTKGRARPLPTLALKTRIHYDETPN